MRQKEMTNTAARPKLLFAITLAAVGGLFAGNFNASRAATTIESICHVKGLEENTLVGVGLVIGLTGTGDSAAFAPKIRALAAQLQRLDQPLSGGAAELVATKNVAFVMVEAKVPAAGARQGDQIDCVVSSIGDAKSLDGGRLEVAFLSGPDPQDMKLYAMASGKISTTVDMPTTGSVHQGAQLLSDDFFYTSAISDGYITLVIDESHRRPSVAKQIVEAIESIYFTDQLDVSYRNVQLSRRDLPTVRAVGAGNVMVKVPTAYLDDENSFLAEILELELTELDPPAKITIRNGVIVGGGDVEISPGWISHNNIGVAAGNVVGQDSIVPFEVGEQAPSPRLKDLVDALNAVKVPTEDMIEIIKAMDREHLIHGRVVIDE
jgi:flagellar P-ring protein precursor FlgI